MSRREFRAPVTIPRPASAFVMSLVASASLWITGELDLWVVPLQGAAYSVAWLTRHRPPAFRKSGIWLNIGMCAVTSVTIAKALAGAPATLSLAYFSALSQGLQLLDARPRKSEFLLVALALFQVILAANLTDSVFFPPLLLVFLVSVTWTLMVHTLRTEAAEARELLSASRPDLETDGLLRTTLLASTVSILLGLLIFTFLPRIRSNILQSNVGPGISIAGFSDRVSLGTVGRIRRDETVVLRVVTVQGEALEPGERYLRGLAFDRFDGRSWSISVPSGQMSRRHVSGSPRFGIDLAGGPGEDAMVQEIVREPVEAGVLFASGPVRRIQGPLDHLSRDANGAFYHPSRAGDRVRYTVWTDPMRVPEALLRDDRVAPPRVLGKSAARRAARYSALPELDPAVRRLALDVTAGLGRDADKLRALEAWLRRVGRYTDEPPEMDALPGASPIEAFLLGDVEGHCEYFASAMVVLARSLDMPARLVNGFAGGRRNSLGDFTEYASADAHAWVEVHFEQAGWVRYDPTPPDLRLRADSGLGLLARLGELAGMVELWWFQRVVDFDSADQIAALRGVWHLFKGMGRRSDTSDQASPGPSRERSADGWMSARLRPTLLVAPLVLLALWLVRRHRNRAPSPVPSLYLKALRALERRGLVRTPTDTARGIARAARAHLPSEEAEGFARITEAYLAERFGARRDACATAALEEDLRNLRRAPILRTMDRAGPEPSTGSQSTP